MPGPGARRAARRSGCRMRQSTRGVRVLLQGVRVPVTAVRFGKQQIMENSTPAHLQTFLVKFFKITQISKRVEFFIINSSTIKDK